MSRDFPGTAVNQFEIADFAVPTSQVTVFAWVRPDAASGTLIGQWGDDNPERSFLLQAGTFAILDAVANFQILNAASPVGTGTWQTIAGTYDGATQKYWKNGIADANTLSWANSLNDATKEITFGLREEGDGYDGAMAHCALWNVALNAAELGALTGGVNPRLIRSGNLEFYIPFFGTGAPESDMSGRGRHASLTGSVPAGTTSPPVVPIVFPTTWSEPAPGAIHTEDSATVIVDLQSSGTETQAFQYIDAGTVYLDLQARSLTPFTDTFVDLDNWEIDPSNPEGISHYYISKIHATDGDTSLRIDQSTSYINDYNFFMKWVDEDGSGVPGIEYWLSYSFFIESWAVIWNEASVNPGWYMSSITDRDLFQQYHIGPLLEATSALGGELNWGAPFDSGGTNSVNITEQAWHTVRISVKYNNDDSLSGKIYVDGTLLDSFTQTGYAGSVRPPLGIIMGHDTSQTRGTIWIDDLEWSPNLDPGEPDAIESGDGTSTEQWVKIIEQGAGISAFAELTLDPAYADTYPEAWAYCEVYIPQSLLDWLGPTSSEYTNGFMELETWGVSVRRVGATNVWKWNAGPDVDFGNVVGDQWYRVEIHMAAGSPDMDIRIDGIQETVTITPVTGINYVSIHTPFDDPPPYTRDRWLGFDNLLYSFEGWISEGSSVADIFTAGFEDRDNLIDAAANYPTPPYYVQFGPNGSSTTLEEGGVGPAPGLPDAIVYLTLTPTFVAVQDTIDSTTVPFRLTPIFATAVDQATVYLNLSAQEGGECHATWSPLFLGEGDATLMWSSAIDQLSWLGTESLAWGNGEVQVEGINC